MSRPTLMSSSVAIVAGVALELATASVAGAQAREPLAPPAHVATIVEPAPPTLPDTIVRGSDGRVTVRAVRLSAPLQIDGRLDEPVYRDVHPFNGFIQQEPHEGQAATEQTEVWVTFDADRVYVSARCWDSAPEKEIVNERRRDHVNIYANENFIVTLDTYYDRRNAFLFQTNPLGAERDGYITDERVHNVDWNTVWDVRTSRDDKGWSLEMAIPFKSLRYRGAGEQVWGINFLRFVRWKNEMSHLTAIPAAWSFRGIYKVSSSATLVGIVPGGSSRSLELKPYVAGSVKTDKTVSPPTSNVVGGDLGVDAKYGLTRSLTGDFTYNTDFAQVEDDEQQVNLTRFSLFFPEKRDFFLEGQGIFGFGGVSTRVTPGAVAGGNQGPGDTPVVFFSRRIGLDNGRTVPIRAGGRVTGRAGPFTIGALQIGTGRSDDGRVEPTNFSVVRLRRDVLRRSSVGLIATNRSVGASGGASQSYGVDAGFAFRTTWTFDGAYVKSHADGRARDGTSYWGKANYNADKLGVELEHLFVGPDFNPEIGFLRRLDFRRNFAQLRVSPRPRRGPIRQVHNEVSVDYVTNSASQIETRVVDASSRSDFSNGDQWEVRYLHDYEFLPRAFTVYPGVVIPVGPYEFQEGQTAFTIGPRRKVNGRIGLARGSFFDGDRTEVSYSGRVEVTPSFMAEPAVTVNWVHLPVGDFRNTVARTRLVYTLSTRSFLAALVQYSSGSHSVSANVRWRWEYRPGSDLFVVFSEGRDTDPHADPRLQNRALVVKLTRLFRL